MSRSLLTLQRQAMGKRGHETEDIIKDALNHPEKIESQRLHLLWNSCRFDLQSNVSALSQFLSTP